MEKMTPIPLNAKEDGHLPHFNCRGGQAGLVSRCRTLAALFVSTFLILSFGFHYVFGSASLSLLRGTCPHRLTIEQRASKVLRENPLIGSLHCDIVSS